MNLSESEAKKRWCPQARVWDWFQWFQSDEDGEGHEPPPPAYNRQICDPQMEGDSVRTAIAHGTCCIGSKCMAWRWAQKPNPDWKPDNGMMSSYQRDTRNDPPMFIDDKKRGHCGLAR